MYRSETIFQNSYTAFSFGYVHFKYALNNTVDKTLRERVDISFIKRVEDVKFAITMETLSLSLDC